MPGWLSLRRASSRTAGCAAPLLTLPILAPLLLAPLLLAGALAACGGDGEAPPKKSEVEAAGEAGGAEPGAAQGPEFKSPAPPPPAPALNVYAEECLAGELPTTEAEMRSLSTSCMEHLLETLRAAIGAGEVPQAEVGPRLDEAEVAVRHLGIDVSNGDRPARVRKAALSLVELAASIGEVVPGASSGQFAGGETEREARAAAEAIDPETPLTQQPAALSRFLRTADGQVRPLVRHLSRPPAGNGEGGPSA